MLNCIDVCPKGLNPGQAIASIAKLSLKRGGLSKERAERLKTLIASADDPALQPASKDDQSPQIDVNSIPTR